MGRQLHAMWGMWGLRGRHGVPEDTHQLLAEPVVLALGAGVSRPRFVVGLEARLAAGFGALVDAGALGADDFAVLAEQALDAVESERLLARAARRQQDGAVVFTRPGRACRRSTRTRGRGIRRRVELRNKLGYQRKSLLQIKQLLRGRSASAWRKLAGDSRVKRRVALVVTGCMRGFVEAFAWRRPLGRRRSPEA
jgi:hypothetical protein